MFSLHAGHGGRPTAPVPCRNRHQQTPIGYGLLQSRAGGMHPLHGHQQPGQASASAGAAAALSAPSLYSTMAQVQKLKELCSSNPVMKDTKLEPKRVVGDFGERVGFTVLQEVVDKDEVGPVVVVVVCSIHM